MKPYTYLIGWSKNNKYYYGAAYRKGCDPTDLWTTYFTSSKNVKKMREMFGEPDIIEVRKTFDLPIDARLWEIKVLRRIRAVERKDFLNLRNPGGTHEKFTTGKGRIPWNFGTKGMGMQKNPFKGVTDRYTDEQRKNISDKTKEAMKHTDRSCYLTRDNCNNRRWMNKDGKHKRVKLDEVFDYKQNGWNEGRLICQNKEGKFTKYEV